MAKLDTNTFKRLRNRYRLVIMNDDTYEEVATFKLSRLSVYIGLSTIFVTLVGLTVSLLSFTSLKYLIPGYGKASSMNELRTLKLRTDSLEHVLVLKDQYFTGIKKVLNGDTQIILDTTVISVPKPDSVNPD